MRWHVRAFDRKHQSFREFVLARIDALNASEEEALLHERPKPDWPTVHRELGKKGVTLDLLWNEYKAQEPGATTIAGSANITSVGRLPFR